MKTSLKRIIADFHQHPFPKYRPRQTIFSPEIEKIWTVVGPRRAGKTTYLFQVMDQLEQQGVPRRNMLYLNFEDERLDLTGNYDWIFDAWLELYPDLDLTRSYIFFDEIQELPQWEKFVRRVYDTHTRHILLTGSNARLLSTEIATALRGHSLSIEMLPLSFPEFLNFRDVNHQDRYSSQNLALIHNAFDEYLVWGGFPELVFVNDTFKVPILQEYFNVMLLRDLVERYGVKDVSAIKYLVKRLVRSYTKEFSIHKIYNELKSKGVSISKDRIYQWVDHVFSIYMIAPLEKYDPSTVRRELSNRKAFLYDNGLLSVANYAFSEDRGKLLENVVFSHLRRRTKDLYFVKNGSECDFLAYFRNEPPQLIQVTDHLHADNWKREFKGLQHAQRKIPDAKPILLVHDPYLPFEAPPDVEILSVVDWLLAET